MYKIKNKTRTWLKLDGKTLLAGHSAEVKELSPQVEHLLRKGAVKILSAGEQATTQATKSKNAGVPPTPVVPDKKFHTEDKGD